MRWAELRGPADGVRAGEQEQELFSTPPAGEVGVADGGPEHGGELPQDVVSGRVTMDVVDLFEVVEVGEDERERGAEPLGAGDLGGERFLAVASVRDAGQPIDERLPLDDPVQPRVLQRDRCVRRQRVRRHRLLDVEGRP